MPVGVLLDNMSSAELSEWMAKKIVESEEREKAEGGRSKLTGGL